MQCVKCGADNLDDDYFCNTCGAQLRSNFGDPPSTVEPAGVAAPPNANPFSDAEPAAKAAFEKTFAPPPPPPPPPPLPAPPQPSIHAPGAGLSPPPTEGYSYAQPANYPPQYAPIPGQPVYGVPPDGNTSGMGEGYPVPEFAKGWTFAGFIPWGLFSFCNGNTTWGVVGLVCWFFGFSIVYWIYMGIKGKESAWQNRRFNSVAEYLDTMRVWNAWGIGLLIAGGVAIALYFLLVFGLVAAGIASGDFK